MSTYITLTSGDKRFADATPQVWNNIPPLFFSYGQFKLHLKTPISVCKLMTTAHRGCFAYVCLRNTLTYLLTILLLVFK